MNVKPHLWYHIALGLLVLIVSACSTTSPRALSIPTPTSSAVSSGPATVTPQIVQPSPSLKCTSAPVADGTKTDPSLPSGCEIAQAVAEGVNVKQWSGEFNPSDDTQKRELCNEGTSFVDGKKCTLGNPSGRETMVLIGDSHAGQWADGLNMIAKQKGWRFVLFLQGVCPAANIPIWNGNFKRHYTECDELHEKAFDFVKTNHPQMVLISSAFTAFTTLDVGGKPTRDGLDKAWAVGLASTINILKEGTSRVVVIGETPHQHAAVPDCVTSNVRDIRPCNSTRDFAVNEVHRQSEKSVSEQNGATYVDVIPWFCTDTICPVVANGIVIYRDIEHISYAYQLLLRGALATAAGLFP